MKTQEDDMHTERGSSRTNGEATGLVGAPAFDQAAVALLAYSYWEARGCPHDSPDEDWFRADAELRNRLASAVAD